MLTGCGFAPWRIRRNDSWPGRDSARTDLGVLVGDHVDGDHRVRLGEDVARLEPRAVQVERGLGVLAGEVVREGERQPERRGDLRAVAARAEQPDLRARRRAPGRR